MDVPLLTRQQAFERGRTRYYTGTPCKRGHIAERYVSTGSCIDCHNPFTLRRHPTRKDVQPYTCAQLWVPKDTTPEQYEQLAVYLQTCIDTFFNHAQATATAVATGPRDTYE